MKNEEWNGFVERLKSLGVTEVVLCAGSRNAPLVQAVAKVDGFNLWKHFDERSAAFFALGRARALGRPVVFLCSSGTAVAESLPAAIEAFYLKVPLILVSADRPARFRATGSPQAIEQPGIFSDYARFLTGDEFLQGEMFETISTTIELLRERPLHINVEIDEPLFGPSPEAPAASPKRTGEHSSPAEFFREHQKLLVIAGAIPKAEAPFVADFLRRLGAPVLAEASSHLRGPELKNLLLEGGEKGLKLNLFDAVVRLGGVPAFRIWRDIDQCQVPTMSLSLEGFSGSPGAATHRLSSFARLIEIDLSHEGRGEATQMVVDQSRKHRSQLMNLLAEFPQSEPTLIHHLSRCFSEGTLVYLGNSLPIREWNLAAHWAAENRYEMVTSRGANGIDGQISQFLGFSQKAPAAVAILGDLTALYDFQALYLASQLPKQNFGLIVINNHRGAIFDFVSGLKTMDASVRETYVSQPHEISFGNFAAQWGLTYERWEGRLGPAGLPPAPFLIEVVPNFEQTKLFYSQWAKHS